MDSGRFDDLTRQLGAGLSRRQALKGLAAGVVGGLAAVVSRRAPGTRAQVDIPDYCQTDEECVEQGYTQGIATCDYHNFPYYRECGCPNGYADCSGVAPDGPKVCCTDSATCPPPGGTTCLGDATTTTTTAAPTTTTTATPTTTTTPAPGGDVPPQAAEARAAGQATGAAAREDARQRRNER